MPQIRKLSTQEVDLLHHKGKSTRKLIEEEYDGYLRDFAVGEYGEVVLGEDENRLQVSNRLKAAAKRRAIRLELLRTHGTMIRFKVATDNSELPVPEPIEVEQSVAPNPVVADAQQTTKKQGGRPKKQVAS